MVRSIPRPGRSVQGPVAALTRRPTVQMRKISDEPAFPIPIWFHDCLERIRRRWVSSRLAPPVARRRCSSRARMRVPTVRRAGRGWAGRSHGPIQRPAARTGPAIGAAGRVIRPPAERSLGPAAPTAFPRGGLAVVPWTGSASRRRGVRGAAASIRRGALPPAPVLGTVGPAAERSGPDRRSILLASAGGGGALRRAGRCPGGAVRAHDPAIQAPRTTFHQRCGRPANRPRRRTACTAICAASLSRPSPGQSPVARPETQLGGGGGLLVQGGENPGRSGPAPGPAALVRGWRVSAWPTGRVDREYWSRR